MESHLSTLTLDRDLAHGGKDVVVGEEVVVVAAQKVDAATVEERSVTVMQNPIQVKFLSGHHFFMPWEKVLHHSWVHLG